MPLAAIGAVGQHRFEFLQFPLGRVDNYRERVIAPQRDRPLTISGRVSSEEIHGPVNLNPFS